MGKTNNSFKNVDIRYFRLNIYAAAIYFVSFDSSTVVRDYTIYKFYFNHVSTHNRATMGVHHILFIKLKFKLDNTCRSSFFRHFRHLPIVPAYKYAPSRLHIVYTLIYYSHFE